MRAEAINNCPAAAWLITQSWEAESPQVFCFATVSICLSHTCCQLTQKLTACWPYLTSPYAAAEGAGGTWIGFTLCLCVCVHVPGAIQFQELPYHGHGSSRGGVCLSRNLSSVCTPPTTTTIASRSRGGVWGREIQLQSFMGHSWVTGCGCNVVLAPTECA